MTATTDLATQVYQVFIKATPEEIWQAITTPDVTARYFHGARIEVSPERYISHGPDGATWADGPVFEYDPPRRLVHQWRSLYDADLAKEQPSRVSWEIEPHEGGYCKLYGIRYQLDNEGIDYKQFLGKPLDVTVTVADPSGTNAKATTRIQIAPTLVNP